MKCLMLLSGVAALGHQVALQTEQVPAPNAPIVPTPMFTDEKAPAVSTTLLCIMNLAAQFFIIYTSLAVVRTINQLYGGYAAAEKIILTTASTVVYAPALSVLFLGTRMRAIQLAQGETEKYELPQPWVQTSMQVASWALLAQVLLVLVMPLITGETAVPVDQDGNVDLEKLKAKMNPTMMTALTLLKFSTMFALYIGVAVVIIGIFAMEPPEAIWGKDGGPPVSPAVSCTINLSCQFLCVYLLAAVVRTLIQFQGQNPTLLKLGNAVTLAQFTVNMAPMLCVLFIGTRMRALQIDPKNGAPQPWAQNMFYMCTYSILVQTVMVLAMPFVYPKVVCKKGDFEGDVVFVGLDGLGAKVLSAIRYTCVFSICIGFVVICYSVFVISAPAGQATPPLSPAMMCVMNLTVQYFLIYGLIFVSQTGKQFDIATEYMKKISMTMEQARGTVMYAPMLAILFIGCRMRALQLAKADDGTVPASAGPPRYAQECMFLSTWAVFIQVVLVCVLSAMYPIQMDEDGNVLPPKGVSPYVGYGLNFLRYFCMISMYGGACGVIYSVFDMKPSTLPPYAKATPLIPGVEVPTPPNPPTAAFLNKF